VNDYSIELVSEDSILISWNLQTALPRPDDARRIAALANKLLVEHSHFIINVVPAYRTLLLQYHVLKTNPAEIVSLLHSLLSSSNRPAQNEQTKARTSHNIPVYYHPEVAQDLDSLCASKKLSIDQLMQKHTQQTYTVYALGFKPGFAYLGYVPAVLQAPRHESFRAEVAAGSVGIADRQTAIYPSKSPGGWNIIGRTPVPMLENNRALLQVGDEVGFYPIDKDEYLSLGGLLEPEVVAR